MTSNAERVKLHAITRLDHEAAVHSSGHQNVHARRYLLPITSGRYVEVMIITKGDQLQLWCEGGSLSRAQGALLGGRFRPGGETYAASNERGEPLYGRHSALKTMDRMHKGDAWRFVPASTAILDEILDTVKR